MNYRKRLLHSAKFKAVKEQMSRGGSDMDEFMKHCAIGEQFVNELFSGCSGDSLAHKGIKGMKWGYTDGKLNGKRTAKEMGRTPEEQAEWERYVDRGVAMDIVSKEMAEMLKQMSVDEANTYIYGPLKDIDTLTKISDLQKERKLNEAKYRARRLNRTNYSVIYPNRKDRGH